MEHSNKKVIVLIISMIIIFFAVNLSCNKEYSCEGDCGDKNKPPIAIAGPDQVITLPTDSISLDGSASNDPDGTISVWLWKKISGPASFNIVNAASSKTVVRNLDTGVYQFELKVTDDKNLSATDTVQITVHKQGQAANRPPVANAGPDQTINFPINSVMLDGSASTDPDNNITNYAWIKISGPSSSTIANPNTVQTQVTNLAEGIYQFELKVTDALGLFDRDTVIAQVTVCPQPSPPPPCATNCGKIVFVSNRDGNDEIYTCNSDGSNITRLTNDPLADALPVWSPDGTKIAFCKSNVTYLDGANIYIMNADGSNVVQLTFTGDAVQPSWSPDGTKIAFTDMVDETINGWVPTIKIVNSSNGSVLMQTGMYGSSVIPYPAWSPDGTKIAFDSDIRLWDVVFHVYTMCPNGGNHSELTAQYGMFNGFWKPAWSPNGSKISVTNFPIANQQASIGVMNADGSGLTVLITDNMGGYNVVTKTSWSPDGQSIAYTSWGTNNTKAIKWIAANGSGASGTIITNGWDADWKH